MSELKLSKIKQNHLVTKRNVLNEMRSNSMTLQELRFFSIYLSKINPKDKTTRIVRFRLSDFKKIMDFNQLRVGYIQDVTNSLLSKIVNVPNEHGGYEAFQLFKKCKVSPDNNGEWYIEIDAHDDALPLMFEFKSHYFSYELWNALSLKSPNQLRMYELLKQYEKIGYRVIKVEELKANLGIKESEYLKYNNFKNRVLESCQKAIEENTDIKFTFEPYGKRGKGGKIITLKFNIYKNENFVEPMNLEQFIDKKDYEKIQLDEEKEKQKKGNWYGRFDFLMEACNNEFSDIEFETIYLLIRDKIHNIDFHSDLDLYNYLHRKYQELNMRATKTKIYSRFSYMKSLIEADGKKLQEIED